MALNAGWDDELLKIELENLKELDFDLELTNILCIALVVVGILLILLGIAILIRLKR